MMGALDTRPCLECGRETGQEGRCGLCVEFRPTDLVFVRDVYGRRHRVRQAHLDEARKPRRADGYGLTFLPRFNQHGRRVVDRGNGKWALHRENLEEARP